MLAGQHRRTDGSRRAQYLRLLRTAGLVRVTIGEEHTYSLRPGAIPQAGPLLETYLSEHTHKE